MFIKKTLFILNKMADGVLSFDAITLAVVEFIDHLLTEANLGSLTASCLWSFLKNNCDASRQILQRERLPKR